MYICICNGLTDRDLRTAQNAGAVREGEVFRHFGVKPQCGRCISCMRGLLGGGDSAPAGERRHATDAAPLAAQPKRQER